MNEGLAAAEFRRTTSSSHELDLEYADALKAHLRDPSEGTLRRGYELGRKAFADGTGILDMAAIHHATLPKVLRRAPRSALEEQLHRADRFFAESLSPFEMAHRGSREALTTLRHLNETMEREIQRIARAVHDEAGQLFDAARLLIPGVATEGGPVLQERLRELGAILDRAEQELRRLSHDLRPMVLDDLGLLAALQVLADSVSRRGKLSVGVESSLEDRLPVRIETALYRIVQEALTNAARHSHATRAKVRLGRNANMNVVCAIEDDGVGFDAAAVLSSKGARGQGVVGMRERLSAVGGTLRIRSRPGAGTEIAAEIPAKP
jgi:two-component system, NarL family, sensor histidine kinase UhpB